MRYSPEGGPAARVPVPGPMTDPAAPADPPAAPSDEDGPVADAVAEGGGEEVAAADDAPAEEEGDPAGEGGGDAVIPSHDDGPDAEGYQWFVLKVTSNREKTVKRSLETRIKREAMEDEFGEIVIPTQKVVDPKGGKKRVVEQKLFPGYMMIQMRMSEDAWYLVRDTTGVGDFTGGSRDKIAQPQPMTQTEVDRMLGGPEVDPETGEEEPAKVQIDLPIGETVKIKDGPFETFEGTVEAIDELHGKVTVLIEIFGSPRPTEFEYWQVEKV